MGEAVITLKIPLATSVMLLSCVVIAALSAADPQQMNSKVYTIANPLTNATRARQFRGEYFEVRLCLLSLSLPPPPNCVVISAIIFFFLVLTRLARFHTTPSIVSN